MRWRTSPLRLGAIALAVALTGSYVWFRADQARQRREAAAAEAAALKPAGLPTTQPSDYFMPSSKSGMVVTRPTSSFSDLARGLSYSYEHPYPSTNPINPGFKLNNDISAEFAVSSDICPGLPEPATAPSSSERSRQP